MIVENLSNLDVSDIKTLRGLDVSKNTMLTSLEPPSVSSLAGEGLIITIRNSPIEQEGVDNLLGKIAKSDILTGTLDLIGSDGPSAAGLAFITLLRKPPRDWTIYF